jgi:hypothetical protein
MSAAGTEQSKRGALEWLVALQRVCADTALVARAEQDMPAERRRKHRQMLAEIRSAVDEAIADAAAPARFALPWHVAAALGVAACVAIGVAAQRLTRR